MTPDPPTRLGPRLAAALVFGSSAAVLTVELVALRLLAPYLGLTLETNTVVIGLALTAIAVGSWSGGKAADQIDPRRALGPLLGTSGAVIALTPFLVRAAGEAAEGLLSATAAVTILVPGALLSAVTPMVTKLRLTSLDETGAVVGSLSGVGTAGAIAGTVLTGFVLVSRLPVSTILVGLGVLLVLAALVLDWRLRGWRRAAVVPGLVVVAGGLGAAYGPGGCDAETTYHCASVVVDPDDSSGRTLVLDAVRNSYVDLDDPTHLEFEYVRAIASVSDAAFPAGAPITAYHLGGGGMTLPRYLDFVRPGTESLVSEIDGGVVRLDREELGLETGAGLDVRVEDGRLGLARLDDESRDLVVGDAFGGVSVPWHLTTTEALEEIRRVLTADGVYAVNLIDHGTLDFVRAETATIAAAFRDVAVLRDPNAKDGGNFVVVASDRAVDLAAVQAAMDARDTGWTALTGADLEEWAGDAEVLTDDHAPVDQLLDPFGS